MEFEHRLLGQGCLKGSTNKGSLRCHIFGPPLESQIVDLSILQGPVTNDHNVTEEMVIWQMLKAKTKVRITIAVKENGFHL